MTSDIYGINFQPSLRDARPSGIRPGVETPGYCRLSLRDFSICSTETYVQNTLGDDGYSHTVCRCIRILVDLVTDVSGFGLDYLFCQRHDVWPSGGPRWTLVQLASLVYFVHGLLAGISCRCIDASSLTFALVLGVCRLRFSSALYRSRVFSSEVLWHGLAVKAWRDRPSRHPSKHSRTTLRSDSPL